MAYVYRSQQSNIDVGTPVIGLPGDIIFIITTDGIPKYNGCYFLQPSGSSRYNQLTGQYGTFGFQILYWDKMQIWANASNDDMVLLAFLEPPNLVGYGSRFHMFDLSYYNLRNANTEGKILYQPYIPVLSGIGSQPYEWVWEKNRVVSLLNGTVLSISSGPYAGRTDVPGNTPQANFFKMEIPCRRILGVNTTPLIVQGGTCVI
jgi:hypothetical protein